MALQESYLLLYPTIIVTGGLGVGKYKKHSLEKKGGIVR